MQKEMAVKYAQKEKQDPGSGPPDHLVATLPCFIRQNH